MEIFIPVVVFVYVALFTFTMVDFWTHNRRLRDEQRKTRAAVEALAKELGYAMFWRSGGVVSNWDEKSFKAKTEKSFRNHKKYIQEGLEKNISKNAGDIDELGRLLDSLSRKLGYQYTNETKVRRGWEKIRKDRK